MPLPEKVPQRPGYDVTLKYIYKRALHLFPDLELVYRTKKGVDRYTFSKAAERMQSLANALRQLGVGSLDVVATLDWNTHWHYEEYYAVPMMGAVLHTVNVRLAPEEIVYVMNSAEDKVVVVHSDFLPLIQAIADKIKTLKHIILVDTDEVPQKIKGIPVHHYEDLIKEYGGKFEWPDLDEDRPAAMCYTSGTTGLPKGTYHSHKMLTLHAMSVALHLVSVTDERLRLSPKDTIMSLVPMYHVYSWGAPYGFTLIGLKQVYPGRFVTKVLLELIKNEKIKYLMGVPTILYMLLTDPDSEKYDLSGVIFVNGGAALPKGLALLARKRGMNVVVGYGLTETAPVLTIASPTFNYEKRFRPEELDEIELRTGFPIPLVDLMVVDENMNPVPKDGKTMGEIVVRAPWITPEYYRNPEKTESAWKGGWFHTGDIAVWFPDGSILIQDRDKDVIKSGGEWISSVRLEDAISQHPGVAEVAVIAAKHPKWQERPVALVVPRPGWENKITTDEIRNFLMKNFVEPGKIAKWWLPDKVIVVESLPKTSVGKINKRVLREKYSNVLLEEK